MNKRRPSIELSFMTLQVVSIAAAAVLFMLGLFLPVPAGVKTFINAACVILVCYDMVADAGAKLLKERRFDLEFLIVAAAAGTFAAGQSAEGAAAVILFKGAGLFQKIFAEKYGIDVGRILDRRPETLSTVVGDTVTRKPAGKLVPGEVFTVSAGERIALDGVVISGESSVDEALETGSAPPRPVARGSAVRAGSLNLTSALNIQATRTFEDSETGLVLQMINEPGRVKSRREKLIGRLKRIYLPSIIAAAVITGLLVPLIGRLPFAPWLTRGLALLMLSTFKYISAALSLTYSAGIGGAAGKGIVIRGAGCADTLSRGTSVVFEKTGILSTGDFKVIDVNAYGMPAEKLMTMAAYAELDAVHPMARSIVDAANPVYDRFRVTNFREYPGLGVEAEVSGASISVGSARLMAQLGITPDISQTEHSVVYVAVNGKYAGRIILSDAIRPDAKKAIRGLQSLGVDRIVIFTGDRKEAVAEIASTLGISEFYAECLPEDKEKRLKSLTEMQLPGDKLIFVGDAIDDAPVLHTADVGVIMGGFKSHTSESGEFELEEGMKEADLIILSDEVAKLPEAVTFARGMDLIARQNLLVSLGLKALTLMMVLAGLLPIWAAVLTESAAVVLTTVNATRAGGYLGGVIRNIRRNNKENAADTEQELTEI